jgi:hypothetical protein
MEILLRIRMSYFLAKTSIVTVFNTLVFDKVLTYVLIFHFSLHSYKPSAPSPLQDFVCFSTYVSPKLHSFKLYRFHARICPLSCSIEVITNATYT